jgi:polysaccharide export outer membrane protein
MRGTERIKFNYNEVIKGKHLEQNILLQDGDHIYVP